MTHPSMSIARAKAAAIWFHILIIAAVPLLATLPAFLYGIFDAHDLPAFHLRWAKLFSEQFWSGDLYPRWLLDMNAGLGGPSFFFYGAVPYIFTSLLRPLIFVSDPYGWNQLALAAYCGLAGSGLTAYFWLRHWVRPSVAVITAILYMLLPYHLAVDLYARFAYGEFWSFVWFPLILYFSQRLVQRQRFAIVGFAISQALLIMTHLPSFLVFSWIPILYVLWMTEKQHRIKVLLQLVGAFGLALGLSGIYWYTAITSQPFVAIATVDRQDKISFFFGGNFLFSKGLEPALQYFWNYLEVTTILTLQVAIYCFLVARRCASDQMRRLAHFWLVIALVSGLMTLPLSQPVWEVLPPLQRIQLPWRFNTSLTVATTGLVAIALSAWKQSVGLSYRSLVMTIGWLLGSSAVLSGLLLLPARTNTAPWDQPANKIMLIMGISIVAVLLAGLRSRKHYHFAIAALLTVTLLLSSTLVIKRSLNPPQHLGVGWEVKRDAVLHRPKWLPDALFTTEGLQQLVRDRFGQSFVTGSGVNVTVQQWKPRQLLLKTQAGAETWLTVRQLYYPGWKATATATATSLAVKPSPEGLLQVKVFPGSQEILLQLEPVMQERIGQGLSLTAGLVVLLLLWKATRSSPRLVEM